MQQFGMETRVLHELERRRIARVPSSQDKVSTNAARELSCRRHLAPIARFGWSLPPRDSPSTMVIYSFWSWQQMSRMLDAVKTQLARHLERVRSRQFLEAAMAASALVASADGEVSFAEVMGRDYVLDRVEQLQVFEAVEAVKLFRDTIEDLQANPEAGAARVRETVARIAGDEELVQLLLRVCVAIAKADSEFSEGEREVVADLCEALGTEMIEVDSLPSS